MADSPAIALLRLDLAWDGTGEPKLLENNAVRQRHCMKPHSFSGSGWKIS